MGSVYVTNNVHVRLRKRVDLRGVITVLLSMCRTNSMSFKKIS